MTRMTVSRRKLFATGACVLAGDWLCRERKSQRIERAKLS